MVKNQNRFNGLTFIETVKTVLVALRLYQPRVSTLG